ncbi:MAG: trypsin-like peptidase domain-containing protein [Paludibacteraceae bacterium]|nr:trypsin-like peptidase domain-containing protein [Paludibacteraceae bacterium]
MKNFLKNLCLIALSVVVSCSLMLFYLKKQQSSEPQTEEQHEQTIVNRKEVKVINNGTNLDFTAAAEMSVNAVVHVKTTYQSQQYNSDPLIDFFFGRPMQPETRMTQASGSGVIISNDGYIVTNNHVIDKARQIQVVLNDKRTYLATLVGTDPNTDIALLKIDENDLPYLNFGNSDSLQVGEWVLAIGNPFNLTSTVTAGIVSAKARNINIINADMKIESFIQTDAAVNPGNSGGALVNTRGELVGINTAIASQTGSYSGYSFAVPAAIVNKVVSDLKLYGTVQRGLMGVQIMDITSDLKQRMHLTTMQGVFVANVISNSAAAKAGLQVGDVITAIDGKTIDGTAQLQEAVGQHRPGDIIEVRYIRNGQTQSTQMELQAPKS